jgi:Rrf2 family protein
MFQVSRRADYAMRMLIELGVQKTGTCLSAQVVSRRTAVPKAFLHKITADLVKAGLVRTIAGSQGGLSLACSAKEITVLNIVEAVEGPICLNSCLLRPHECPRDLICPGHGFWGRIQNMLVAELKATTLAQLAEEADELRQEPGRPDYISYLFGQEKEIPLAV